MNKVLVLDSVSRTLYVMASEIVAWTESKDGGTLLWLRGISDEFFVRETPGAIYRAVTEALQGETP